MMHLVLVTFFCRLCFFSVCCAIIVLSVDLLWAEKVVSKMVSSVENASCDADCAICSG